MFHFCRVHENQSINRMPLKNLAVVFGPTLLRCHHTGNEEQQMREMIDTVEFIIQQSHILFADYSWNKRDMYLIPKDFVISVVGKLRYWSLITKKNKIKKTYLTISVLNKN